MRELRDDSLIDMKFMIEDAGYTAKYFYSQINAESPQANQTWSHITMMLPTTTGNAATYPI